MKPIIQKVVFRIFAVVLVMVSLMIGKECLVGLVCQSFAATALALMLVIMCVIAAVLLWTYDDDGYTL